MAYKIDEIEGIGPAYAARLNDAGIRTTDDFLSCCHDARGREAMAGKTGISARLILTWANLADLMRIKGVGRQYAEVLHAAGVDTIRELRTRNAENLAAAMESANAAKNLANACPGASVVRDWIEKAKTLDPVVSH